MKHLLLLSTALVVVLIQAGAQVRKSYTVKPGEKPLDVLPKDAVYLYPAFKEGNVTFRDKNVSTAMLNYNCLIGEIQFIGNKGDTMSLADEKNIASVVMDKDTFFYAGTWVKKMADVKDARFAVRKVLGISNHQKVGAMGGVTSSSTTSYDRLLSSQGIKELVLREYVTFSEYNYFFIGDAYNHFKPLTKKNLMNMYAKQQGAVEKFISDQSINFLNEEDVKKLVTFLQGL